MSDLLSVLDGTLEADPDPDAEWTCGVPEEVSIVGALQLAVQHVSLDAIKELQQRIIATCIKHSKREAPDAPE